MSSPSSVFPPVDSRRRRGFLALVIGGAIIWFPASAIAIALPALQDEFDASLSQLAWLPTTYMLVFAALVPIVGRWSDRQGRRLTIRIGAAIFAVATLAAAAAPSYALLLLALVVMGIGGVLISVAIFAIADVAYVGAARGKAIGVVSASTGLGQAIGVPIGGTLVDSAVGWPAIVWICSPLALLVVVLAASLEETSEPSSVRLDLVGAACLGSALVVVTIVGVQGPDWGWTAPTTLVLTAVTIGLFAALPALLKRADDPIAPPELATRPYLGGVGLIALANIPLSAVLFLLPLLLQNGFGESATLGGWVLLAFGVPLVAFGIVSGWLIRPLGLRTAGVAGCVAMAAGAATLSIIDIGAGPADLVAGMVLIGAGAGLSVAVASTVAIASVRTEVASSASALLAALSFLGGAIGFALAAGLFDAFAGPDASNAIADNDLAAIVDGVRGTFAVVAVLTLAIGAVPLATFPRRHTEDQPSPRT
ncbi:MAG: MFS transporter [Actinomycetota bacterium]